MYNIKYKDIAWTDLGLNKVQSVNRNWFEIFICYKIACNTPPPPQKNLLLLLLFIQQNIKLRSKFIGPVSLI